MINKKFKDLPYRLKKSDYKKVINNFVRAFSEFNDVISIYQVGGVFAPGISDLDFFVVTKKKVNKQKDITKKLTKFRTKYSKFLVHDPVFMNRTTFKSIYKIFPLFNLKHIFGEKIENDPDKLKTPYVLINYLNELNLSVFTPYLNALIDPSPWEIRSLLCRLASFKYTYRLFNICTGLEIPHANKYIKETENLRTNWFKLSKSNQIKKVNNLLKNNVNLSSDIVEKLSFYLETKEIVFFNYSQQIKLFLIPRINIYLPNWNKKLVFDYAKKIFREKKLIVSPLPLNFIVPILYSNDIKYLVPNKSRELIKTKEYHFKYAKEVKEVEEVFLGHDKYILKNNLPKLLSRYHLPSLKTKIYKILLRKIFDLKLGTYQND